MFSKHNIYTMYRLEIQKLQAYFKELHQSIFLTQYNFSC